MPDRKQVVVEAQKIVQSGKYSYGQKRGKGYETDDVMDCSEFVYHSYRNAGYRSFPTHDSRTMAAQFPCAVKPEPGDILYWKMGHVAILEDPETGLFLGAQSTKSGLKRDNFKSGWWSKQKGLSILRYEP